MSQMKFRKTSLQKILDESLSRFSETPGVQIVLKNVSDVDEAWLDHDSLTSVFSDLLKNAFEAMNGSGVLTLTVGGDDRRICITFSDTGRGIKEEELPMLFTPFFTTKKVGEGTGLGLPVAYATIKEHQGDITIESNADPDKGPTGTTVKIVLPRRQAFQEKGSKIILHEED